MIAPRTFVSRYVGFQPSHFMMEYIVAGYFRAALRLCGAKNVKTKRTAPIRAGGPFSEITVTWD